MIHSSKGFWGSTSESELVKIYESFIPDKGVGEMHDGLYVTLDSKGKIKRHLYAKRREMPLRDTTVSDELIQFSEKIIPFNVNEDPRGLWDVVQRIEQNPEIYDYFQQLFHDYVVLTRLTDPVHAVLTRTKLEDNVPPSSRDARHLKGNVLTALACMTDASTAQIIVNHALDHVCLRKPIDKDINKLYLHRSYVTLVLTQEDELKTQYLFRAEDTYYYFLLQHFIASNPNVARCEFCGRIFIPKTRKKTKYCDRIVRNGRTCKQVAPRLTYKERASAIRVVSEYNRIKDMLIHRMERTSVDKKPSLIDLSRAEYYMWLDAATHARDRYLAGNLTEEEAMAIIYVPQKDEMLENNSAEYTLENVGT